jgi:pSer/pThr/pTyr-binding forkhead associated (FHA) protein
MLFCEECGGPLTGFDIQASQIQTTEHLSLENSHKSSIRENPIQVGSHALRSDTTLILRFRIHGQQTQISLGPQSEIVIGRNDEASHTYPDLDLTPQGGVEQGVSRQHAVIRRTETNLTLTDLGSANGTYINGQNLIPHQPRILKDGDELRFGKLVSHIFFK